MKEAREVAVGWLQKKLSRGQGVGPKEADSLIRSGAMLLDVREPVEWHAGHAPVARHVPLGSLEGKLGELPREQNVVVVCRSGNRSARATSLLVRSGFEAVNLVGGMQAWAAAGFPVETVGSQPGRVV
jgi:rhodanese-related sulfurtransferase